MRNTDSFPAFKSDPLAEADGSNMMAVRIRSDAIEDGFAISNVDFLPVFLLGVVQHEWFSISLNE